MSNFHAGGAVLTRLMLGLTLTGSVLLAGCAGTGGHASNVAASTQVKHYPSCYEPVSHLRNTENTIQRTVATGAIAGSLLGALAGAVASDSDDRGRNALIGAAGGALVGGAAGYYSARQQMIADDNQRIASYAADFGRSAVEVDRSVAYASAAQSCYQREFSALRDARKAGTIDADQGRQRLNEIVAGLQETNALLQQVDGRVGEDVQTYTQAYEQDLQQTGVQRQAVAQVVQQPTTAAAPVARRVPAEAVVTERAVQQVQSKRAQSQEVVNNGRSLVSDVCNNPDMGDWAPANCRA